MKVLAYKLEQREKDGWLAHYIDPHSGKEKKNWKAV